MGNPAMQRSLWGPRKNRRTFPAIFAAPTRSRRSNSPEKNLKLQSPLKQQPNRTPLLERRPALAPEQVAGGRKASSSRRSFKVDQAAFGFFHFQLIHGAIKFPLVLTAGRFKPTASRPSTDKHINRAIGWQQAPPANPQQHHHWPAFFHAISPTDHKQYPAGPYPAWLAANRAYMKSGSCF